MAKNNKSADRASLSQTLVPSQGGSSSSSDRSAPPERKGAKAAILAVLAVGLGISSYLTYHHVRLTYGEYFDSLCNISETINCDTVNTSDYSEVFKLPIALYAIPTYLVLAFLTLKSFGRQDDEVDPLAYVFGISTLTALSSLGLGFISIFQIKAVCLFCISLYLVNFLTFGLSWWASRRSPGANIAMIFRGLGSRPGVAIQAALVLLVTFGVAWGAENAYKNKLIEEGTTRVKAQAPATKSDDGLVNENDAYLGPKDAKVTVVEFADFECGYCKRMSYTMKALKDQYHDRVKFVFKNFPMSPKCNNAVKNNKHPYACDAARAGICANRAGKFWDFHDLTYKNQRNLKLDDLAVYAEKVGIDPAQFSQCMADSSTQQVIQADVEASRPFEITGTPRTIVNGQQFKGVVPKEILEAAILKALGESEAAKPAAPPADAAAPAGDPSTAPAMTEIKLGDKAFLIDSFEASRGSRGEAVSAFDKAPWYKSSWYDGKAACEAAGKRLCTQGEWVSACQNALAVDDDHNNRLGDDLVEGTEFAYSDFYVDGVCNDKPVGGDPRQDAENGRVAFTGSFPRCHTPSGVYDMNGNLQEWVGTDEGTALLMGGTYYNGEKASCFQVQDTFGPGFANKATGFRCCKDK